MLAGHLSAQAKPAGGAATFTGLGTNLVVKDFAKSLAFYKDTLGFTVVSALPPAAPHVFAWVQRGGVHVFLNDLATVQKDPVLTKRYKPGPGGVAMFVLMTGIDGLCGAIKGKATVTEPDRDEGVRQPRVHRHRPRRLRDYIFGNGEEVDLNTVRSRHGPAFWLAHL